MIGDHHSRTAGEATLLVRAVDEVFGTHTTPVGIVGDMDITSLIINLVLIALIPLSLARYDVESLILLTTCPLAAERLLV
jgi:hypothetical protein